ncbi:MAG TPA: uracil-DNA glycosylase [Candidatus Paceibacterota bacterium]|nr:uracil-DNA glycosylase [Candidatus Paceibacterota bacterium]
MDNKAELLKALEREMEADRSLPLQESNLVFGEGNPDCKVMFIGEGPGFYEDKMKRPFVGRAGQLLDRLIAGIGWRREDVYITNIVKRRPPENRDPFPNEIAAYAPYLTRQIEIIGPTVIVPLGRFAMNYFLPQAKISRDQGKLFKSGGRYIYPLFHPAAALRGTETLNALTSSFMKLPDMLKKLDAVAEIVADEKKGSAQESLF